MIVRFNRPCLLNLNLRLDKLNNYNFKRKTQSKVQLRLRGIRGGRERVEEVSRQALNLDQSKLSCGGFLRRQVLTLFPAFEQLVQ